MGNVKLFVSINGNGYGNGYGDGNGNGYGDGDGNGYGYGYGDGNGYGYGDGNGNGYGDGDGNGYGYGYGDGNGCGNGNGYGDGNGYGYGYGDGNGCGNGNGYGDGNGYGNGYGVGVGNGYACGISKFNNETVHIIDSIPTIITRLKDNIAKGFILNQDFTLTKCYIVKRDDLFAHGETLRDALKSLQDKIIENMNVEERIEMFMEEFNLTERYPSMKFFEWHHKLTGSCEMGRKTFAKNHGIDLETDTFTVSEFIELTENDYGSEVIKQLKERIKQ